MKRPELFDVRQALGKTSGWSSIRRERKETRGESTGIQRISGRKPETLFCPEAKINILSIPENQVLPFSRSGVYQAIVTAKGRTTKDLIKMRTGEGRTKQRKSNLHTDDTDFTG
jgi:hypothetical protein